MKTEIFRPWKKTRGRRGKAVSEETESGKKKETLFGRFRTKRKKNSAYSKLIFRIFMQTVVIVILTFLIIFTLYKRFWFRRVGDWIVQFLQDAFDLELLDALNIYQYGLRENAWLIIFGAVAVCFLVLFRISLSWFIKYFNEIDAGLDKLIKGDDKEIALTQEMAPMEQKLNALRQTLEKRELESRLAEERKNNLVMYLAHDIRTPLTSVIGYLSLLEEAPDMPAEQKAKYVHITLEKANRLEQLINEFFEITRYNIQEIILEKEEIDLYYMLLQMLEEFYPLLEEKGNQAVLHSDENVALYGDPVKLARVFHNILKNAIAYSYRDTRIDIFVEEVYEEEGKETGRKSVSQEETKGADRKSVSREETKDADRKSVSQEETKGVDRKSVSREETKSADRKSVSREETKGADRKSVWQKASKDTAKGKSGSGKALEEKKTSPDKIMITFQNQGKTIPREKLESIFDKFYRMDEARNSNTGGAGLGLAIAKEIVTRHGGRIFAESEKEQVTFRVELPAK